MTDNDIPNGPRQWTTPALRRRSIERRFEAKQAELAALPRPARRRLQRAAGASIAAIAMSFAVAPIVPAGATATFTVTTTNDVLDADCALITDANIDSLGGDDLISLREAICAANQTAGNDTIVLPAGTVTITLNASIGSEDLGAEDDFDILPNGSVTIVGNDDGTTIDGGGVDRVFDVLPGSTATFDKLTIQNGVTADNGGGIFAQSSSTLTITNSLIRDNSSAWGGGVYAADGSITNTTFVDNAASSVGGGLYTSGASIDHVTMVGNTANWGGGVGASGSGVTISNSLIAGNEANTYDDVSYANSATNSVIGSSGSTFAESIGGVSSSIDDTVVVATSDGPAFGWEAATHTPTALAAIVGAVPADNGGPTNTLALPEGSPAIGAAAVGAPLDQRGEARSADTAPDAGAFEHDPESPDEVDPTAAFSPSADAKVIQGTTVTLALECEDDVSLASCVATVDGTPIADGDALPTSAHGDITITVIATDEAGNEDVVTRVVTVLPKQTLLGDYAGAAELDGAVARLYMANFARQPDAAGFNYWLDQISSDWTLARMASHFTLSDEFQATYGDVEDDDFVELMYQNVLGRSSDAAGKEYWLGRLSDDLTRGDVLFLFSDSIEFRGLTGTS